MKKQNIYFIKSFLCKLFFSRQVILYKTNEPHDDFNIFYPVVVGRAQMPRAEEKLEIYIKESQPILPGPGRLKDSTTQEMYTCVFNCDYNLKKKLKIIFNCGFKQGCQFHFVSSGMIETFHTNLKNRTNFISF